MTNLIDKTHGVRVTRDVRYAIARVNVSTKPAERELLLDVYQPEDLAAGTRSPALVLAFGGAFHRGSRESDRVDAEGQKNTTIAEYCRLFAQRGYSSFSIDYRLVQEDPDPGSTPVITNEASIPRSRIDVVRAKLGLPPATFTMLKAGIEAAADDMATAVTFVRANAVRFGVDPHRIALGGFSAGARTALNVAYGERVPVSAVVSLSGFIGPDDLTRHVTGEGQPPVLLFSGEHDLDYIAKSFAGTAAYFRAKGLLHGAHVVPTVDHFYPATSTIPLLDGKTTTVEGVMAEFFATYLARVDHARAPSARI